MVRFLILTLFISAFELLNLTANELGKTVGLTEIEDPSGLGFDSVKLDGIYAVQQKLIVDKHAPSNVGLVVRKGKVVYHRAAYSSMSHDRMITDSTVFPIWSMSKPITSVAAMILYERGKFKLDDPVSDALPEMAAVKVKSMNGKLEPLVKPITYRDLFRHTAGFNGYEGLYNADGFWAKTTQAKSLTVIIRELANQPIEHQPSAKYTYGMNTAVLGRAVEVLSGKSFNKFLLKEIFRPLKMGNTRFHLSKRTRKLFQPLSVFEDGNYRGGKPEEDELAYEKDSTLYLGGEGLVSTLSDYSRFCQMLVNGGVASGGKKILSPETLKLMWTDQIGNIPGYDDRKNGNGFGLGFYVLNDFNKFGAEGVFGWGGYHTTHFWVDPKNDLYAIFMCRRYPYNGETLTQFRKAVYESLIR
mgnify:FL=1